MPPIIFLHEKEWAAGCYHAAHPIGIKWDALLWFKCHMLYSRWHVFFQLNIYVRTVAAVDKDLDYDRLFPTGLGLVFNIPPHPAHYSWKNKLRNPNRSLRGSISLLQTASAWKGRRIPSLGLNHAAVHCTFWSQPVAPFYMRHLPRGAEQVSL